MIFSKNKSSLCYILLIFGIASTTCAQSIQHPSLSPKTSSTLIIDSIPVIKTKNYRLTGIDQNSKDYRLFFGISRISEYPSFGISRTRPHIVVQNNAFTHESLFDPLATNSAQNTSWDNPYGSLSFGEGVVIGSIQLISDILNK